jgi:membrane-associated protease RseP (regulator of RpoE activity)
VDWLPVALLGVFISYLILTWYIRRRKIREDIITFYGPIMAIKTTRIGFFDRFKPYATFFRIYGTVGIVMVVMVSAVMTFLLLLRFPQEVAQPPLPEGIYSPPNWLALPGVNQFIPFTIPVILGLAITIAIHELGHGILCRVEGILVKSMGVLLFVIPIGFFVEPDEEELDRAPPVPKSRMFGAGIANNLILGFLCFIGLIFLLGLLVPVPGPIVYGTWGNYPAYNASLPLGSVIRGVNGERVATVDDVSRILGTTRPGDSISLTVLPAEVVRDLPPAGPEPGGTTYTINLTSAPDRSYGFMGVNYYDPGLTLGFMKSLASPVGFAFLGILPIDILPGYNQFPQLHLIFIESLDMTFFRLPFPLYWGLVHFLFWCGWFNFIVGTFNALPMVPFDGGFIMKEGVTGLTRRLRRPELADRIVLGISLVIVVIVILIVTIPLIVQGISLLTKAVTTLWTGG